MSYPRIVNAVFNSPWAIQRPWLGTIFQLLHSRVFADGSALDRIPEDPDRLFAAEQFAGQGRGKQAAFNVSRCLRASNGRVIDHSARIHSEAVRRCGGSVANYHNIVREEEAALPAGQILHVFGSGVMGKHLSSMDELCAGGLSVDRIQEGLRLARDDDKVAAVMLHLDTPGGICYGMPETAALVRAIRDDEKTVAAFCDSLTASAGYWCTAASDFFYITPSADVGSVGVYSAVVDYSEWCQKQGIKVDLIKDGTFKGAGFPGTSLTEEQRAKIEADVMACSAAFKRDVREGREGVSDETLQGQCFSGSEAVSAKLADAVVNSLEEALADLAQTI